MIPLRSIDYLVYPDHSNTYSKNGISCHIKENKVIVSLEVLYKHKEKMEIILTIG